MGPVNTTCFAIEAFADRNGARSALAFLPGPGDFAKLVVKKSLAEEYAGSPSAREAFFEGARAAGRLNHPNVARVLRLLDESSPFGDATVSARAPAHASLPTLLVEFFDGQPLSRLLQNGRRILTTRETLALLIDVLDALEAAHGDALAHEEHDGAPLALVHRDLAADRILITYDGAVKVLGFEDLRFVDPDADRAFRLAQGGFAHLAPEQLSGVPVDGRADLFAVGCLAWSAVVGRELWNGATDEAIEAALTAGEIPLPSDVGEVAPELETIIARALAFDPDERFASAREFRDQISEYLEATGAPLDRRAVGERIAAHFGDERMQREEAVRRASAAAVPSSIGPFTVVPLVEETAFVEPTQPGAQPRSRSFAWFVAVAALALGGAAAYVVALRAEATNAGSRASTLDSDQHVVMTFRGTPEHARLYLDGVQLTGNPARVELPRDGVLHDVRAEAPGFMPETRSIHLADGSEVHLDLRPLPPVSVAPVIPAVEPAAAAPSSSTEVVRVPGPLPRADRKNDTAEPDCSLPYYFVNGVKVFRPECL
jgi:serine/threonine-protein kinase